MTRSKLSDADKQEILTLYRESPETASTLAERYGVSSTTIRRTLRSILSSQEYETLTNQKQTSKPADPNQSLLPLLSSEELSGEDFPTASPYLKETESESTDLAANPGFNQPRPVLVSTEMPTPVRRSRKRSSATGQVRADQISKQPLALNRDTALPSLELLPVVPALLDDFDPASSYDSNESESFQVLEADLDSVLEGLDAEDFEDDLDSEETGDDTPAYTDHQLPAQAFVHVLPLSEAAIPRTCYLVIDRFAELITRPLRDFGELGQIPSEEVLENTLPVFDNHRVARRFSNRTQRVIKIPNGTMLQKACSHLHSKGITRLLINGQVYSY